MPFFLAEPVVPFDWQRLPGPGEHPPLCALEVVVRCVATYLEQIPGEYTV